MTIKNFGLMWERDEVHWWGPKQSIGRLMGMGPIGEAKRNQKLVDFAPQIGVYILYQNDSVIYVGQAGRGKKSNLFLRLKKHQGDHLADRWNRFSWFGLRNVNADGELSKAEKGVRHLNFNEVLDLLEGILINVVEPPLNKQGARWSGIEQFFQYYEGWSNWSDRELLIEIASKHEIEP